MYDIDQIFVKTLTSYQFSFINIQYTILLSGGSSQSFSASVHNLFILLFCFTALQVHTNSKQKCSVECVLAVGSSLFLRSSSKIFNFSQTKSWHTSKWSSPLVPSDVPSHLCVQPNYMLMLCCVIVGVVTTRTSTQLLPKGRPYVSGRCLEGFQQVQKSNGIVAVI